MSMTGPLSITPFAMAWAEYEQRTTAKAAFEAGYQAGITYASSQLSDDIEHAETRAYTAEETVKLRGTEIERLKAALLLCRPHVKDAIGGFDEDNNGWSEERALLATIDAVWYGCEGRE